MDWSFPGEGRVRLSIPGLPRGNDWIGVNYYSRVHLRFRGSRARRESTCTGTRRAGA
jgi:hypothetical protein